MGDAAEGRGGGSSAAAPLSVTRAAPHREGRGRAGAPPGWARGGRAGAGRGAAAVSPVRRGAAAAGPGAFIGSVPGAARRRRRRDWPPPSGPAAPPPLIGRAAALAHRPDRHRHRAARLGSVRQDTARPRADPTGTAALNPFPVSRGRPVMGIYSVPRRPPQPPERSINRAGLDFAPLRTPCRCGTPRDSSRLAATKRFVSCLRSPSISGGVGATTFLILKEKKNAPLFFPFTYLL